MARGLLPKFVLTGGIAFVVEHAVVLLNIETVGMFVYFVMFLFGTFLSGCITDLAGYTVLPSSTS